MKYEDGQVTKHVRNMAENSKFDIYENPEDLIAYISDISTQPLFADGIKELCIAHGYEGDISDSKQLNSYIVKMAKNNKVIQTAQEQNLFKTNIGHWLKEGEINKKSGKVYSAPDDGRRSRINVYRLCFALGLDIAEIEEFFLKKYLCRPFNFRNLQETVFFYALKNGKDYCYADKLYKEILAKISFSSTSDFSCINTKIFKSGLNLDEEEFFVDYCLKNNDYFDKNNLTAVEEIKHLLEDCYEFIAGELYEEKSANKVSYVLRAIYGGEASYYDREEKKWIKKSSNNEILRTLKERMPKKISAKMPSEEEISKINNNEKVGSEILRKTLILLNFYNFFMVSNDDNSEDYSEDFIMDMDNLLDKCGFVQSYARNPYDWVFMYCAKRKHPVETFNEIIREYICHK